MPAIFRVCLFLYAGDWLITHIQYGQYGYFPTPGSKNVTCNKFN